MGGGEINGAVGDKGEGQNSQRKVRREEEKSEGDHMVPGRKSNILRTRGKKSQLVNRVEEPRSSVRM
jgi:hypothetical protein